jgi:hypothetical protein
MSISTADGKILERQKDKDTAEWKYRINGKSLSGGEVEVVTKLSPTGKLVIITCPHCGKSYLDAETLHEIERIKLHKKSFAIKRSVPVAEFA